MGWPRPLAEARAERARQRRQTCESLARQERFLQVQIEEKEGDLTRLGREISLVRSQPKGTPGRRAQRNRLLDQQRDLERPLTKLSRQLDGIRALQAQYR